MIAAGKVEGIINVASWGYESFDLGYRSTSLYRDNPTLTQTEFLKRYLTEQRAQELGVIQTLEQQLLNAPRPIWMVSVVTKQDLWADHGDEVIAHYEQGTYDSHVKKIEQTLGVARFHHKYCYVSLIISNFRTGKDEQLAQTVGGYDQIAQVEGQQRLLQTIVGLMKR